MKFNARGGISILELIVYFPSLVMALLICCRHGFSRSSGWIYLAIFSIIRFVGACCQLATYNNPSKGLYQASAIISSIALSPLLLATLGLLSRSADSDNRTRAQGRPFSLSALHFHAVHVLILVAMILGIVGGTSSTVTPSGSLHVASTMKIAIVLFTVGYAAIVLTTILTIVLSSSYTASSTVVDEKRLVLAVVLSLPLLLVRLIYSTLSVFTHSRDFNLLDGKVAIWVVMAVLEEFGVVGIYLLAGWLALSC